MCSILPQSEPKINPVERHATIYNDIIQVGEVVHLDEWLTTNEVAALLKVNPETVKRWLRGGEMTGSLLSDRAGWRIAKDEIQRFMAARSNAGTRPGDGPKTRVS